MYPDLGVPLISLEVVLSFLVTICFIHLSLLFNFSIICAAAVAGTSSCLEMMSVSIFNMLLYNDNFSFLWSMFSVIPNSTVMTFHRLNILTGRTHFSLTLTLCGSQTFSDGPPLCRRGSKPSTLM